MRIRIIAAIVACASVLGLSLILPGPASGSALPKVIQNCGRHRACASVRPPAFNPGHGLGIDRIKWHSYTSTRAVGWGRFGTTWRCGGSLDAEQMTCVKITLSHPVTEHGITYFKTLLYQPATMGGYSGWDWHAAAYEGEF
jgi:hypothetical protein